MIKREDLSDAIKLDERLRCLDCAIAVLIKAKTISELPITLVKLDEYPNLSFRLDNTTAIHLLEAERGKIRDALSQIGVWIEDEQ